jgi:hypothetical protein
VSPRAPIERETSADVRRATFIPPSTTRACRAGRAPLPLGVVRARGVTRGRAGATPCGALTLPAPSRAALRAHEYDQSPRGDRAVGVLADGLDFVPVHPTIEP